MLTRQQIIDRLLDHYEHPRNRGVLPTANVVAHSGQTGCGDRLTLYVRTDAHQRIQAVTFEGEGCTISQAAASILTDYLPGHTLEEATHLSDEAVLDMLGREVVSTRLKCATLALNALRAAVHPHP